MQRANSTVRCRLAFFCLFSAVIGLGATTSAKAQSPETVDCKNEGMEVADASMIKAACYKRDITGARVRETLTQLEGQLLGAFIIVRRLKAGFRTYIQGQSAQEWLSQDSTFSHIEGYSWHQTVLGFETGTYHGTVPEAGPSV